MLPPRDEVRYAKVFEVYLEWQRCTPTLQVWTGACCGASAETADLRAVERHTELLR